MALISDAEYTGDIDIAIGDSPETFVYHRVGAQVTDYRRGTLTKPTTDVACTGLVESLKEPEISKSGGLFQLGDKRFWIKDETLGGTDPRLPDFVTWDSRDYRLVFWKRDATGLLWGIVGRRSDA